MKPGRIVGIIFGVLMIALAIGAATSGEASAQTDNGTIAIAFVVLLGVLMIVSNIVAVNKDAAAAKNPLSPPAPTMQAPIQRTLTTVAVGPKCPSCDKGISSDFVACPFCGCAVKQKCPNCSKVLDSEFVACPYCGTKVKET